MAFWRTPKGSYSPTGRSEHLLETSFPLKPTRRHLQRSPTYQLWPFSFPPENPPKSPKWGPQNEFSGITRTKGFCGNSTETLDFPEFPGPSQFRTLGSPFSAFRGEMKLICWAALSHTEFLWNFPNFPSSPEFHQFPEISEKKSGGERNSRKQPLLRTT